MALTKNDPNEQTKLDIIQTRKKTSFNTEVIKHFLHNGEEEWKTHSKVVQIVSHDPVFDMSRRHFMTRGEHYKRALLTTNRIYELKNLERLTPRESSIAVDLLDEHVPMNVHASAFEPIFNSQGSPALLEKYGRLVAHRGILGCYLQTELGHGTNVSQLETTATYIPAAQEFEMNSPTVTSSKWWVGALGKTATHGVVQAKLILPHGEDVGPHLFFVQLRSLESHRVLPGITIGDIGPKAMAGYATTDNGFARFDRVRVPKEHMLSKFAQVTEDGHYVQPPHPKLSYGGMLYIRSQMVTAGGWTMAKAATVAIRYTTVRRQGSKGADGLERQVISYPSVHYRLLPILSHAYVFIILGRSLSRTFEATSARLASGDTSFLAEMHAMSSGLKVLVTTTGVHDLEVARRSMGGHGYSAFAGLGRLYANYLPSVTYEGDNFVLDQQVVRAALKTYKKLPLSSLSPSSNYLRLLNRSSELPKITDSSWADHGTAVLLLEWRAALMVKEYAQYESHPDAGAYHRVSKAVTEAFVAARVGEILETLPFAQREKSVVGELYRLYLLTTVEAAYGDLLSFGLLVTDMPTGRDPTRSLRVAIANLCRNLLPNAIGLSDAFGFTDWELDSALGVYNGNVYEELYKCAQKEPLNQTEVPEGYEEYIKPLLQRGQQLATKGLSKL